MPKKWTEQEVALPPGNWRLDPFTRIVRWVPGDPNAALPDAFDATADVVEVKDAGRPLMPIDHGTYRGARAHYRRGERLCQPCRAAEYDYAAARARRKYAEGDPLFTCECGAFKAKRTSGHCASCAQRYRNARERKAA